MYRLTDHSSLPVMGYGSALSVIAGQRLGFHVSSAQGEVAARIVRLDREARPELPWALQASGAPWQVQGFELGSWLEVPLSEDAGVLSWALLLTVNQSERPLLATADFECRYGPAGVLMLTGAAQPFAVALPRQEWLQVRFEWTAHTRRVSIAAGDWVLFDQACTGFKEGSIETVKIASDWQQQLPTLNARIADIQLHAAGRLSSWTLPTSPVQEVADLHGSGGPLKVHGAPTFAVRGPHWNGDFHDPRGAPEHYAAIHLHEDDKPAFQWPETLALQVPSDAESGVYALRIQSTQGPCDIPFVIRPAQPATGLVFLLPTLSYQAYANEALPEGLYPWLVEEPAHRASQQNQWRSVYDSHQDGSGVSLATWPCPWTTMRDAYQYPLCGGPHGLPMDLHMLRFFAEAGLDVTVISDHDLHRDPHCLNAASAIVTGSHPEYWTATMLDHLDSALARGASLAYLGGNGFYWVSALDAAGTLEVRRGQRGVRTWESAPGENHLAQTGEMGGLWRWRGRAEHRLLGVGTAAMGFTQGQPYQRTPASYSADWAWVFAGVEGAQIDGNSLLLGGAAGYEIDRTSQYWGTPAGTVVLASADTFDDSYELDFGELEPHDGPKRRADVCIRRTPAGGLVFAVGSVSWGGALGGNSAGQVTVNVLRRMSEAGANL